MPERGNQGNAAAVVRHARVGDLHFPILPRARHPFLNFIGSPPQIAAPEFVAFHQASRPRIKHDTLRQAQPPEKLHLVSFRAHKPISWNITGQGCVIVCTGYVPICAGQRRIICAVSCFMRPFLPQRQASVILYAGNVRCLGAVTSLFFALRHV